MSNQAVSASYLLRLVGLFGIAVGIAWAIQTLWFGDLTTVARIGWLVAAASMCGAGAGLLIAAYSALDWPAGEGRL